LISGLGSFIKIEEFNIRGMIMDTSNLNSQERRHLKTYAGFMSLSKYFVIATAVTLAIMAIFLT
jgi:hypothetical protein